MHLPYGSLCPVRSLDAQNRGLFEPAKAPQYFNHSAFSRYYRSPNRQQPDGRLRQSYFQWNGLYDALLTSRIAMQVGVGYRQKGFRSEAFYQQDRGYAVFLSPRTVQDNLFHYASSELSFQFRTRPRRTVGYLRLGQRLDYLLDFKSAFWGDNYGYFTQFDYNVFAGVGVEYALNKKLFRKQNDSESQPVFSRPTTLFIELEGTPLLFNISRTRTLSVPVVQLTDPQGNPLVYPLMRVEKIVRNTGFGVVVGIRF